VLIASFPAGPWQTNCYVAATQAGAECVIVDPGLDSVDKIREIVAAQRLKPVAVLLTHGHLDHMFSVTPVCASYHSTCWIHPEDRDLLADPLRAMSADTHALLRQLTGASTTFTEPDEVAEMVDGTEIEVAGMTFHALHAPGHTPGSVMFTTAYPDEADVDSLVFSGDVLFAGAIGRTDLPGGNHADMLNSLRTKVLPLADSAVVLPGHGSQTTIARERAGNPYLSTDYLSRSIP